MTTSWSRHRPSISWIAPARSSANSIAIAYTDDARSPCSPCSASAATSAVIDRWYRGNASVATDLPACSNALRRPSERVRLPAPSTPSIAISTARAYLPVERAAGRTLGAERAAGRTFGVKAASVAVVGRLVGALDVYAEVFGLVLGQLGQLTAQRLDVDAGHLLVEVLGQPVHLVVVLVIL